jgi:hypothetical protein
MAVPARSGGAPWYSYQDQRATALVHISGMKVDRRHRLFMLLIVAGAILLIIVMAAALTR